MLDLDMKTTIVIYMIINYTCTYIIFLIWFQNKNRFKGINFFLANFIFQSLGLTLSIFRGFAPLFLSIIISNLLIFSGIILILFGLSLFLNVEIKKKPYYIYMFIFFILYFHFTYNNSDVRTRILIFAIMIIPIFIRIIHLIFFSKNKNNHNYAFLTGKVFVGFLFLYALRFYYALTGGTITNYFTTPMMDTILIILNQICTILLVYSLQLMISAKQFFKIEQNSIEMDILLKKAEELATIDTLTNIYNRRKMSELLLYEIEQFKRYNKPFSILLADIDYFKHFNDTYGHDIGDKALIKLTQILNKNLRNTDFLGRWGGEEFLIILPGLKLSEAISTSEKLIEIVASEKLDFINNSNERINISIGASEFDINLNFDSIIKCSDKALYMAKQNGRNRVEFYKKDQLS